jgi:TetR/AcrR family transcriptional repressor of nem operon
VTRSPSWSIDALLDAAGDSFAVFGFQAAPIGELVEASGVARAGIYATFGSKEGLYEAALSRYLALRIAPMRLRFARATLPISEARAVLDEAIDHWLAAAPRRGCLAVLALTELGQHQPSLRHRLETSFRGLVEALNKPRRIQPTCEAAGPAALTGEPPCGDLFLSSWMASSIAVRAGWSESKVRSMGAHLRVAVK